MKTSNINYFTYRNIAGRAGRMGSHFIGKVFILEEPPLEDVHAVNLPIEEQTEHTPLPLLLDLPVEDLSPISSQRILEISAGTFLSMDTIRANRHIPIEIQNDVAKLLQQNAQVRNALSWRGMPSGSQLKATCSVLFEYFDTSSVLKGYQIHSGEQLAASLTRLQNVESLRQYIDERLAFRRGDETVSKNVEDTLKFMRKYVGYRLPKQLIALDNIHRDVSRKMGDRTYSNYEFYAASVEGLFIDSGLFALDEYGLPPELTRKFMRKGSRVDSLNDAIRLVFDAGDIISDLHPFERRLIDSFRSMVKRPIAG